MIIKGFIILFIFITYSFSLTFKETLNVEKKDGILKALNLYKNLAKQNNKDAIFRLAIIYEKGEKVKKNIKYSYIFLLKGSTLGDLKSAYYLSKLYLKKIQYIMMN